MSASLSSSRTGRSIFSTGSLVWFSPRDDCRLQVVDRFTLDPRTEVCLAQVRDVWEGTGQPGRQLVFTQVYYPHPPWPPRPDTNNPGAKANYRGGDLEASAGASGITVLRDDVEASVLRLQLDPGRAEWVVFNPGDSSPPSIRPRFCLRQKTRGLRRVGGQKPRLGKNRKITNADTSAAVQVNAGTPEWF